MQKLKFYFIGIVFTVFVQGCGDDDGNTTTPETTLFDKLGGEDGIAMIVDGTIDRIATDNDLAPYFEYVLVLDDNATELNRLKRNLVEFLSAATGSEDAVYNGLSMRNAHRESTNPRMVGIISDADFNKFVEFVGLAAADEEISQTDITEVAALLETTRSDIVTSLFDELGGASAISAVVDKTIERIIADTGEGGMAPFFEIVLTEVGKKNQSGLNNLKENLVDFFSVVTGDPNATYSGKSMAEAHSESTNSRMVGIISDEDFDNFVELVKLAAKDVEVSIANRDRIAALLETTRGDVVSTLYDELGGTEAITLVVENAINRIAADIGEGGIADYFSVLLIELEAENSTGFNMLRDNLVDYLRVATGDPSATYSGISMSDAHDPAKNDRINGLVTDIAFSRFITHIGEAANEKGVSEANIARIAAALENDRNDIVGE